LVGDLRKADVFIVGGGPAGLAAAIAARQRGFSVTVADGIVPPADKACGEGLMPDSLAALASLGVHIDPSDSFPFRGIRFFDRGASVAASFPRESGRGVRRTVLHRIMLEHAESLGVRLLWNTHVDLDSLRCGWLVGADGGSSTVRKWAGLDKSFRERRRFGFRRHYRVEPWTDYVEIYWADNCQIYVTPVGRDCVCVAAITDAPGMRLDDVLRLLPELAWRLQPKATMTRDRGAVSASRRLKAVYRNRVALIGDASGSIDAITGEGLSLAFRQAPALAEAIEAGDLAQYQRKHREIALRPQWMARLLLGLGDHAAFRFAAIRGMAACPVIFEKMLALHIGELHETRHSYPSYIDANAVRAGNGTRTRSRSDASPVHAK
jgi:flavin-dependent dehydrogenase